MLHPLFNIDNSGSNTTAISRYIRDSVSSFNIDITTYNKLMVDVSNLNLRESVFKAEEVLLNKLKEIDNDLVTNHSSDKTSIKEFSRVIFKSSIDLAGNTKLGPGNICLLNTQTKIKFEEYSKTDHLITLFDKHYIDFFFANITCGFFPLGTINKNILVLLNPQDTIHNYVVYSPINYVSLTCQTLSKSMCTFCVNIEKNDGFFILPELDNTSWKNFIIKVDV